MKRLVALMRENSEKVLELLNNPSNKINKYIKDFCHALFNDEKYYFDNYRDFQCELEETVRLDTDFIYSIIEELIEEYEINNNITLTDKEKNDIVSDLKFSDVMFKRLAEIVFNYANEMGTFNTSDTEAY